MEQAVAETIASESGVNAEIVAVTEAAELLEGVLVIDFGAATPSVLTRYENPDTKEDIGDILEEFKYREKVEEYIKKVSRESK